MTNLSTILNEENLTKSQQKMLSKKFGADALYMAVAQEHLSEENYVAPETDEEFQEDLEMLRNFLHLTPKKEIPSVQDVQDALEEHEDTTDEKPKGARPKIGSYEIDRTLSKVDLRLLSGDLEASDKEYA